MTHQQNDIETILRINVDGTTMNDYLKIKLDKMMKDLLKVAPDIISLDIFLTELPGDWRPARKVSARLTLPSIKFHASDSGYQWKLLLKHVELRLKRSIDKRKELLRKQEKGNLVSVQLDPNV